jgi:exodeoxyribonuclease V beta subunit
MSAPPDDPRQDGRDEPGDAAIARTVTEVTTVVTTEMTTAMTTEVTTVVTNVVAIRERVSIDELAEPIAAEPAAVASLLAEGGDAPEPDASDPVAEAAAAEAARGRTFFHPRPAVLPDPAHRLVVVEASAGTGKTYFLEHRVVDLILQAGAELPQILIVTFTEKATAELRRRIHDLVDRMSRVTSAPPVASAGAAAAPDDEAGDPAERDPAATWCIDPAARARLRAAAHAFSQSAIFTIHGFCHRVLLEDAFAANRLFEQVQVADEIAFRSAFYDVLRDTLAVAPEHAELLEVYLRGSSVDKLEQLLLSSMRAQAMPRSRTGAVTMRRMLTELGVLADEPSRASLLADLGLAKPTHHHRRWVDEITYAVAGARQLARVAEMVIALAPARECAGKLVEKLGNPRNASAGELLAALQQLASLPALEELVVSQFLPDVIARVERDKAIRGQLDYQDMLVLVRDALHGPRGPEIAQRLRGRTPWVLIDEFQDTDDVQWDIFRTVWLPGATGGLTVVGDPKQSIYSFRGADVMTYLRATAELVAGGAAQVFLQQNHRSTAELVDITNRLLLSDPLTPFFDGEIRYDHPVEASGRITLETPGVRPMAVLAIRSTEEKPSVDAARYALRDAIANEIEGLRKAPLAWRKDGQLRTMGLSDIFILTRSSREAQDMAHTLRSRGIPCALVQNEHLFATREAAELAELMTAIAVPRDRSARLRALRTRFFDVQWSQLMELVDAPDHHPMLRALYDWHRLAKDREYERLFHQLLDDSRYAERALILGSAPRSLVNTQHLLELCAAHVAVTRCDIHDLVFEIRRWISDDVVRPDDLDVQRIESDGDAVVIQTIHRAKGLEAPVVFLYGGDGRPPGGSTAVRTYHKEDRRVLAIGPQETADAEAITDEVRRENQRLCYVAMTRAQLRLYLPLYVKAEPDSAIAPIQRYLRPLHTHKSVAFLVDVRDVPVPGGGGFFAGEALADFSPPRPPAPRPPVTVPPRQRGIAIVSYTRLVAHGAVGLEVNAPDLLIDEEPVAHSVDELPREALPPGAESGLFLHDLFERVDVAELGRLHEEGASAAEWVQTPPVRELVEAAARQRRIERVRALSGAELVFQTLTQPLTSRGNLKAALPPLYQAQLAREVEFLFPLPSGEVGRRGDRGDRGLGDAPRGYVKGFIDLLVRSGDDLWVLDYKSDFLGDGGEASARQRVDDKYQLQARLYAVAAERMVPPGCRLAGLLFAFVRHQLVIGVATPPAELRRWHHWLSQLEVAP